MRQLRTVQEAPARSRREGLWAPQLCWDHGDPKSSFPGTTSTLAVRERFWGSFRLALAGEDSCILLCFPISIISATSRNSMNQQLKDQLICTERSRKQRRCRRSLTLIQVMSSGEKQRLVLWLIYNGGQVRISFSAGLVEPSAKGEHFSHLCSGLFAGPLHTAWLGGDSSAFWSCWSSAIRKLHLMLHLLWLRVTGLRGLGSPGTRSEWVHPHGARGWLAWKLLPGARARQVGEMLVLCRVPSPESWRLPGGGARATTGRERSKAAGSSFSLRCADGRAAAPMKPRAVDQRPGCQSPARVIQGVQGGWAPPAHCL